MLGGRLTVTAVVAFFAVTVRAQNTVTSKPAQTTGGSPAQTTGGSSCPSGNFLYNVSLSGKTYTITMPHATIADGMTINNECFFAAMLGASMLDSSGSGQKGYNLMCASGTVQLTGISCQPPSSVSGSSSFSSAGGGATSGAATTSSSGTVATSVTGAPKLETCLDVKKEYQRQGCCGTPTKMFDMGDKGIQSGGRRLSQDTLLANVKLMLEDAKLQEGATYASNMAADLIHFLKKATQEV